MRDLIVGEICVTIYIYIYIWFQGFVVDVFLSFTNSVLNWDHHPKYD